MQQELPFIVHATRELELIGELSHPTTPVVMAMLRAYSDEQPTGGYHANLVAMLSQIATLPDAAASAFLAEHGLLDRDAPYLGQPGSFVSRLLQMLAELPLSSRTHALSRFYQLASFQALSPLTSDPDEWIDRREESNGRPFWQSMRTPSVFSHNGGQTWYDLNTETPEEQAVRCERELALWRD